MAGRMVIRKMKRMKILFFLLFPVLLSAQVSPYKDAYERGKPPVELGRALLPGMMTFVGAAMPDTKRGRAVQITLFFGAGVTVGVWDRKRNRTRSILICLGSGLAGAALGYAVRPK